ncbi:MAG: hypothetical protein QG597_4654 [Actinomycetota bacterium]|nr:hypothetical protein [Actinomycetota bacterium]
MLRRLDLKNSWRSLDAGFWPDNLPLGRKTVIYGHNGSGKSTLSELLLSLAEGKCCTDVIWENEDSERASVPLDGTSPSVSMAVFTRKWVEENLSAFLDGANASAIVTLGREAIDAKEEEARLVNEIEKLRNEEREVAEQLRVINDKVGELAREVQDRIVSELKEYDYNHYTKNRYTVTKVQALLREYKGEFPDSNSHAEALKRLGEGAPSFVVEISEPSVGVVDSLADLVDLLAETPTQIVIKALEINRTAQEWVEQGLELHERLDHCLFCAGEINEARRAQLARHFDETWLRIRDKAKALLDAVTKAKMELTDWCAELPLATYLASELRLMFEDAMTCVKVEVEERVAAFEAVEFALRTKVDDPSATPEAPVWSVLCAGPSITALARAVAKHNDQVRRHTEVADGQKMRVLDHLVGSRSEEFRMFEGQAKDLAIKSTTAKDAVDRAGRLLGDIRQAQFTTKDMADTLTRDLVRVYGKGHLSVTVTPDGKSYACRRGGKPGTYLSEGERTTLSLLYFLRKLQDQQMQAGDLSRRIVVIDDPSSSLDRESLFVTHQCLIDALENFGQYIILTHDFSLLRLFIKSHKNAWGKSAKSIQDGKVDEIRFPKVSFLEMYAGTIDGERHSKIGQLPLLLRNNTSEYAYLFSMVATGVTKPDDHERLFLLPNAARRVIEVFASYKAPHCPNFRGQLQAVVDSQEGESFRDVYDFCNRFSHGEGSESVDILDARTVHGQIRRCMEFMHSVDSEHFERMCEAAGLDPANLL